MISSEHSLRRTSPKGGPFIGRCIKCGETMSLENMKKTACANPIGMTQEEALLDALNSNSIEGGQS